MRKDILIIDYIYVIFRLVNKIVTSIKTLFRYELIGGKWFKNRFDSTDRKTGH